MLRGDSTCEEIGDVGMLGMAACFFQSLAHLVEGRSIASRVPEEYWLDG